MESNSVKMREPPKIFDTKIVWQHMIKPRVTLGYGNNSKIEMGNPQPSLNYIMDYDMGEIYMITCIKNNKSYIGQARCYIGKNNENHGTNGRWRRHISKARNNKQTWSNDTIWAAFKEYHEDSFIVKMLEKCQITQLDEKEAYYIQKYNTLSPNGYNKLDATQRIFNNKCWTQDQRNNISKVHKKTMTELPMYMVYVKARPEIYQTDGYAILNHPKSRAKYFTSKKLSLEVKYQMALDYLNTLCI